MASEATGDSKAQGEEIIDWETALEEMGNDWDFLIEMLCEFYNTIVAKTGQALKALNSYKKHRDAGTDVPWTELKEMADDVHYPAHTLKGTGRQCACNALGQAAEDVEQAVRAVRDMKDDTTEDRAKLVKGLDVVYDTHMPVMLCCIVEYLRMMDGMPANELAEDGVSEATLKIKASCTEADFRATLKDELAGWDI